MTTKARQTLADARVALEDFEASPATPFWRTRWIAVVTILRAVGHVAEGVDGKMDAEMRAAIKAEFGELQGTKPEPRIWWDFILSERNRALKEMTLGARMNITVRPGSSWFNLKTGESGGTDGEPTLYEHFMAGEIYEGRDPRELAREAIEFWTSYLDRVDQRANAMRT